MLGKTYNHWREVDAAAFRRRWPNFSPQEIACKGTGRLLINEAGLDALQALRNMLGKPLILTSAYRSPQHNASLPGAARNSQHLNGHAFDVQMTNHDPEAFEKAARACGFRGIGHYPRSGFMHIDLRAEFTRWNTGGWFPARPPEARVFAPEPQARSLLATGTGRNALGGLSMAVATIATAAPQLVEVAQHPLANAVPWVGTSLAVLAMVAFIIAIIRKSRSERYEGNEQ